MKCKDSNGKYILFSLTKQDCLRAYISLAKKDIEGMEQQIKDLDFYHYQRTGKFPE